MAACNEPVKNQTPSQETNGVLTSFKRAMRQLPASPPDAKKPADMNAKGMGMTYTALVNEAHTDNITVWELLDRKLNRLCGSDISIESIKPYIHSGDDGIEGFYQMLTEFLAGRHIESNVLEGKISRLVEAMISIVLTNLDRGRQSENGTVGALSVGGQTGQPIIDVDAPTTDEAPIDVDLLDENNMPVRKTVAFHIKTKKTKSHKRCPGILIVFPPGQNPYIIYPFAMHVNHETPWDVYIIRSRMFLRSWSCDEFMPDGASACDACIRLRKHSILVGILERIKTGVHENAPHHYQSIAGLLAIIARKVARINLLRLLKLNDKRALLHRAQQIEDGKRLVMAIASGKGVRVSALVRTAVKRGSSVRAMVMSLEKAAIGLYKPKSIEEREILLGWLLWKFGGPRSLGIANRALGLPSVSTVRRRMPVERLEISHLIPTVAEYVKNIGRMFASDLIRTDAPVKKPGTRGFGYVIQFDEIAVEKRIRYDSSTNRIIGVAREHASETPREFTSIDDAHQLFDNFADGRAVMANEATVVCLGAMSGDTRVYAGRPIGISGTCKTEKGDTHVKLIENAITACGKAADQLQGYVMCVASDGESRRGLSFNILTMQSPLSDTSPIYPLLSPLTLLDLNVGKDDLTGDKDYKHVFKRFRNLLLRAKGLQVDGVHINRSTLSSHFHLEGLKEDRIHSLLNPDDKQDVVLAYNLLKEIYLLKPPTASQVLEKPAFARNRRALNILGKLFGQLLAPYTSIDMSLSEQLSHLSTAAHMLLALYTQNHARALFMPVQLYADTMIMIKNAFFCVAKMKVYDPKGLFYLILMGTDRLEVLFGIVRTITGNDSNPDLLQLGWRLSDSGTASEILAAYPEWDRVPRRLNLPAFSTRGDVHRQADHINPGSWTGDVQVANATPLTSWREGQRRAAINLVDLQTRIQWEHFYANQNINILQPFGQPILKRTGEVASEGDDDDEEDLDENRTGPPLEKAPEHEVALANEIDLEDLAGADDAGGGNDRSYITLNDKKINKARILREWSKYYSSPNSTDRLKRVAQISRYATTPPTRNGIIDNDSLFGGPILSFNDPVATLVTVNDIVFLAIGQVISLKNGQSTVDSIDLALLREPSISATLQILQILPTSTSESVDATASDWSWSQQFEGTINTSGRFIHPINPPTSVNTFPPTYLFRSDELRAIGATMHDTMAPGDVKHLPVVKQTPTFPYRNHDDEACFVLESDGNEIPEDDDNNHCDYCPSPPQINWQSVQAVVSHMGSHVLHDPNFDRKIPVCGGCLKPLPTCHLVFRKASGTQKKEQLDVPRCVGCRIFRVGGIESFKYEYAAKSSKRSPCSNVPLKCPVCPADAPLVWKYSLEAHLRRDHQVDAEHYRSKYEITQEEKDRMKKAYEDRGKGRVQKSKPAPTLRISAAHSSSLAGTEK
ncbi:hypothetical protein SISNIDRAFT_417371 [Sistotremastrum niveocremeum HHB9708]|uniref:Uncharacterized protein n=1 Tax=Sistotremastrum niveocremeum HHB9708 TaxID=1314777 RepID=A0A164PR62_9AGAM|nr:hypothetical protein SISNIDRAFT_417371 [Sistotremastrum niveocremeum HHB9708]